jgi:hypothetical protein
MLLGVLACLSIRLYCAFLAKENIDRSLVRSIAFSLLGITLLFLNPAKAGAATIAEAGGKKTDRWTGRARQRELNLEFPLLLKPQVRH